MRQCRRSKSPRATMTGSQATFPVPGSPHSGLTALSAFHPHALRSSSAKHQQRRARGPRRPPRGPCIGDQVSITKGETFVVAQLVKPIGVLAERVSDSPRILTHTGSWRRALAKGSLSRSCRGRAETPHSQTTMLPTAPLQEDGDGPALTRKTRTLNLTL